MIAKPEWFTYRLAGWGIRAKTWQGWAYFGVFLVLVLTLPYWPISEALKRILTWTLIGLFSADCMVIWAQLGKYHDERQRLHQLIIERNCSVVAVLSLCAVIIYRSWQNKIPIDTGSFPFDPLLLLVLGAMMITKLTTSFYVRYRK